MRFRRSGRPTPYLNRRDQWRILRLVGLLAVVLIAISFAARPSTWDWMFPEQAEAPRGQDVPAMKDVDFRVRQPDEGPLPEDVFRVEVAEESPAEEPRPARAGECDIELSRQLLKPIEDRTLGIPPDEAAAFYAVLAHADRLPPGCLRKAGRDVPYTVLMTHPEEYRGMPVTIEGTLRQFSRIPATRNEAGIEHFYEAWLTTRDSGSRLYRVVTADNPDGLPEGRWTDRNAAGIRVRTTGYLFKLEGYATQGGEGLTVAPLLVADSLQRLAAPPPVPAAEMPIVEYVIGIAVALTLIFGAVFWWLRRRDVQFERTTLKRYTDVPREQIDTLQNVETTDPGDIFRCMTEQERGENAP